MGKVGNWVFLLAVADEIVEGECVAVPDGDADLAEALDEVEHELLLESRVLSPICNRGRPRSVTSVDSIRAPRPQIRSGSIEITQKREREWVTLTYLSRTEKKTEMEDVQGAAMAEEGTGAPTSAGARPVLGASILEAHVRVLPGDPLRILQPAASHHFPNRNPDQQRRQ